MPIKTYKTTLFRDGAMCVVPVPFDPKELFGKVRAPVRVTLNGYTFRSTIAAMGGPLFIPLRKSNREAAGLEGTETLKVTVELDTDVREVNPPADLVRALKASPGAWKRWEKSSYTHRREHAEAVVDAKKPETRLRRIAAVVKSLSTRRP